ncbi:TraB/GumN family protein [Halovulum sp. GXIMD14793]
MIARFTALLVALASPSLAYDDATLLSMCEPEVIEITQALLGIDDWNEVDAQASKVVNGTGRLWRVTTPEGQVSYLWGTMHSSDPRISNVPDELKAIIADARIMITEYAGAETTMDEVRKYWSGEGFYSDTPVSLYNDLPAEALRAIQDRIKGLGLLGSELEYMAPTTLMNFILSSPCGDRLAVAGYPIQDVRVELLAADHGLSRISAERRDVIEVLATAKRWEQAFRATVTSYALHQTTPETSATYMRYYLDGQIGHMMAFDDIYLQNKFPNVDVSSLRLEMDSYLLTHRNRRMVENLLPQFQQGGAVVAVGCYHLPHDTGLVALLRQHGMTVERIALPGEAG